MMEMDLEVESPPLIFYDSPGMSTGALFSGQLKINIVDDLVTLDNFEARLSIVITTNKPVVPHCMDCTTQIINIQEWRFLQSPTSLRPGLHAYPFSHLLPGHLPATTHGKFATLSYYLYAVATTTSSEKFKYKRSIDVNRVLLSSGAKKSTCTYPPTNILTSVKFPASIHHKDDFSIEMCLSGILRDGAKRQSRWRLRHLKWRIEETQKFVAPTCPKHRRESKGVVYEDTCSIAKGELIQDWRINFEQGSIGVKFRAGCDKTLEPLCDMRYSNMEVKHKMVVQMTVSEEMALKGNLGQAIPVGAPRILRTDIPLVLTEKSGMGIPWDQERPPLYEDVPTSPPGYMHGSNVEL